MERGKYFSLFGNRFGTRLTIVLSQEALRQPNYTHLQSSFYSRLLRWNTPSLHPFSRSPCEESEWVTLLYLFLDTPREASNTATQINLSLPVAINVPSGTLNFCQHNDGENMPIAADPCYSDALPRSGEPSNTPSPNLVKKPPCYRSKA